MDIKPRIGNGHTGQAPQQRTQAVHGKSKNRWVLRGSIIVIIVLLILGGIWYCVVGRNGSQVDSSKYQAVFLNNNQVYFGKLHNYGTNQPYLTSVWYIQTPSGTSDATKASSQQLQLTQLTKAVHGPLDEMILNKSQILFVENLSSNSQVTKLINSSK